MGVNIQQVTKEIAEIKGLDIPEGALVSSVAKNSPAEKAGIKMGDIIVEVDGKDIDNVRTLQKIVAKAGESKNVIIKIWRNKEIISKKVLLGRLESSKEFVLLKENEAPTEIKSLKISVRLLTEEDISQRQLPLDTTGVVITKIASDSPVHNYLKVNDIIVEVQETKINSLNQLKDILNKSFGKGEKTLLFATYNNQNVRRYLGIRLN